MFGLNHHRSLLFIFLFLLGFSILRLWKHEILWIIHLIHLRLLLWLMESSVSHWLYGLNWLHESWWIILNRLSLRKLVRIRRLEIISHVRRTLRIYITSLNAGQFPTLFRLLFWLFWSLLARNLRLQLLMLLLNLMTL